MRWGLFVPYDPIRGGLQSKSPDSLRSPVFFIFSLMQASLQRLKIKKPWSQGFCFAEREGFEPPVPCGTPVFKTGAFDHSATRPGCFQVTQLRFSRNTPGIQATSEVRHPALTGPPLAGKMGTFGASHKLAELLTRTRTTPWQALNVPANCVVAVLDATRSPNLRVALPSRPPARRAKSPGNCVK